MTFASSPLAVDGALIESALIRRGTYASTGGNQGIVNKSDLKVTQLAVPGVGVLINAGVGLVVNGYQTEANETYVASNPDTHTITSGEMPPVDVADKSYILAITVGDPEFSQTGHPWMTGADPAPGEENTFEYVRPYFIEVPAGTTTLDVGYPALPLARIDIPANTSTITDSMIVDLRELAQPRSKVAINHATASGDNVLNGAGGVPGDYEGFPNQDVVTVKVPEWAVVAKVTGFVEGIVLTKAGNARLRAAIKQTGDATAVTNLNESAPANGNDKRSYNVGGVIAIPDSIRGTTVDFIVQGTPINTNSKGAFTCDANNTSALLQVIFEEEPS